MIGINVVNINPIITGKHNPTTSGKLRPAIDIPTGQDVRRLRDIFENNETKNAFLSKGFDASMQILEFKKPHLVSSFYRDIESVIVGLKEINAQELDDIVSEEDSEKEKMIRDLAKWSQKVVKIIESEKEKNGI